MHIQVIIKFFLENWQGFHINIPHSAEQEVVRLVSRWHWYALVSFLALDQGLVYSVATCHVSEQLWLIDVALIPMRSYRWIESVKRVPLHSPCISCSS